LAATQDRVIFIQFSGRHIHLLRRVVGRSRSFLFRGSRVGIASDEEHRTDSDCAGGG
jgi:hypothetical protein